MHTILYKTKYFVNNIICGWNLFLLLINDLSLVHFKWLKGEADINKFIIYIRKSNNMNKKQHGLLWYFVNSTIKLLLYISWIKYENLIIILGYFRKYCERCSSVQNLGTNIQFFRYNNTLCSLMEFKHIVLLENKEHAILSFIKINKFKITMFLININWKHHFCSYTLRLQLIQSLHFKNS